ncbi:gp14 [Sphingomonas phage PAU]|uniref:gp14 n=1 Tax=Sphingomonas phage PAU TaxID=1150991 RepID=UPI0002573113|nr:gp14 [Sphingomonas phage PAU]AFF28012.1 gp14 [Sphingomonas phage PAU]
MLVATSVPLLNGLKDSGGTFYTLSPTLNDFNTIFSGSNIKLVPSKFALLKLPKWQNTSGQTIFKDPAAFGGPTVTDPNILVPKLIQDYLEVFNNYSYTNRLDTTLFNASEIGFWKMLKDVGAMQFEDDGTYTQDNRVYTRFIEKQESPDYDPVVKYIGDINLLNHISKDGQSYTEIYLHVPTESGKIDRISFTQNDVKWRLPEFPENGGGDLAPGLDAHDGTGNVKAIYDTSDKKYKVSEALDNSVIYWDDIENNATDSYKKGNYEFNAIAVYYDIWNENDKTTIARNLYGIFFIDKFVPASGGSYELKEFQKVQPSQDAAGNSYGFRINLKFSNASNQVSSEITINDYNTISMELYMKALELMTEANWNQQKLLQTNALLIQKINQLESSYGEFIPLDETTKELQQLRNILRQLDTNNQVFAPQQIFSDIPPTNGIFIEGSVYWDKTAKKIYQYRNNNWVFQTDF